MKHTFREDLQVRHGVGHSLRVHISDLQMPEHIYVFASYINGYDESVNVDYHIYFTKSFFEQISTFKLGHIPILDL